MSNEDNIIDVEIENLPVLADSESGTYESEPPMKATLSGGRTWPQGPTEENRCVAHKKDGTRCKRHAIKGGTVCRVHGGAAPHVRAAAKARLDNAADRMAKQLLGIATDESVGAETRLKAVINALDRTIGRAPTTVEIGPAKTHEIVFDDILSGTRAESRAARGFPDIPTSYTPEVDSTTAPSPPASAYPEHDPCVENGSSSEDHTPPPSSRPHEFDRHTQAQPPARHITGEAAMRIANQANRQVGALPPMQELESPHKRYPKPR